MIELSQPNLSKIKKLILKVLNSKKLVDGFFKIWPKKSKE